MRIRWRRNLLLKILLLGCVLYYTLLYHYGWLRALVAWQNTAQWLHFRDDLERFLNASHPPHPPAPTHWCPLFRSLGHRLAVVIPFVAKDVPLILRNIALWQSRMRPSVHGERLALVNGERPADGQGDGCALNTDLIFYFATEADPELEEHLLDAVRRAPAVAQAFKGVSVWSAGLNDQENRRVTIADTTGPNNQFFRLMERLAVNATYNYVWYMEPDVFTIRKYWLDKVALETVSGDAAGFWIKGTIHRKDNRDFSENYLQHRFHFNGAALYRADDPLFVAFLRAVRQYTAARPYDFGLDELLHSRETWRDMQHLIHKFVYTDFVQNRHGDDISLEALLTRHPNTFFVHGLQDNAQLYATATPVATDP